jgi:uncharacterized OsmC-like protein
VPGDILCGALAACADSTLRVVAHQMGLPLDELAVQASAVVDVRGTLGAARDVPVPFLRFRLEIAMRFAGSVEAGAADRLVATAERCCVVLQTLRAAAPVELVVIRAAA